MPRRPQRTVPTVVIPGWQGSGEGHWQTWLEDQLRETGRETRRPEFADLESPDLADWLAALRAALSDLPGGFDVLAHSLGVLLWLHHVANPGHSPQPERVLLVAPPSPRTDIIPGADEFFPPPLDVDAVRAGAGGTVLVGTDNDPYLPEGIAETYGRPLKIATTIVPGGGHLNPDAGYGAWPAVLDWCSRENLAFF